MFEKLSVEDSPAQNDPVHQGFVANQQPKTGVCVFFEKRVAFLLSYEYKMHNEVSSRFVVKAQR